MAMVSNSQRVSLVAIFTALAVVLNFAVSIPAPYAPYLSYEVWEVPVLVSVFLLGAWSGLGVAALNTLVLEIHPGPLPTGPVYNLIAELSMIAGVIAVRRLMRGGRWRAPAVWGAATAAGATLRTLVMTLVNAEVLSQPYPIGFSLPSEAVPATLVLIGIFNLTVALYTLPLAFSVAGAVKTRYPRLFPAGVSPGAKPLSA